MGRKERVRVFKDTQERIKNSPRLRDAVEYSIENTLFYDGSYIFLKPKLKETRKTKVSVTRERSFEAAMRVSEKGKCVAVHNFANAFTPGGGVVDGASAQEESLCRCSTLYPVLTGSTTTFSYYYDYNRSHMSCIGPNSLLYTPDVVIFKTDVENPKLMDVKDWCNVDVITMAAPDLRGKALNYGKLYQIHLNRANILMSAAYENKADKLVLGAFGCGAFKNDPIIVMNAYKEVLKRFDGCFEEVIFAVYCSPEDDTNYQVFTKITSP